MAACIWRTIPQSYMFLLRQNEGKREQSALVQFLLTVSREFIGRAGGHILLSQVLYKLAAAFIQSTCPHIYARARRHRGQFICVYIISNGGGGGDPALSIPFKEIYRTPSARDSRASNRALHNSCARAHRPRFVAGVGWWCGGLCRAYTKRHTDSPSYPDPRTSRAINKAQCQRYSLLYSERGSRARRRALSKGIAICMRRSVAFWPTLDVVYA